MNKLQKLLRSGSAAIKGVRADLVSEDMMYAQKRLVEKYEDEERALTRKLNSLNDLYPDSELSLRVVKADFDPDKWARETQDIKERLAVNKVSLESARETYNEWFTEVKAAPKTTKKAPATAKAEK